MNKYAISTILITLLVTNNIGQAQSNKKVKAAKHHKSMIKPVYVTIAPDVGVPTQQDGSDLLVNGPPINTGVALMQRSASERQAMSKQKQALFPHLLLSGGVEAAYQQSDMHINRAELDGLVEMSANANAYVSMNIDGNGQAPTFALNAALISIGNLLNNPFYISVGQCYVPFGRYGSRMISRPINELMGGTKAPTLTLGYHPLRSNAFYLSGFVFKPNVNVLGQANHFSGGVDAGYHFKYAGMDVDLGASYINNIENSDGMLVNGRSQYFPGFKKQGNHKSVPGADVHLGIKYRKIAISAEYTGAISRFASDDMTFDGKAARPGALTFEADMQYTLFSVPSVFGLGYTQSVEALAMNLPLRRYAAVMTMNPTKDVLFSMEYDINQQYPLHSTARAGSQVAFDASRLGKMNQVFTVQVGAYF